MRLCLALISAAVLATVNATPTTMPKSNMAVDPKEFKALQVSTLELKEDFETFHWIKADQDAMIDRAFTLDLKEPAELQITDFMMGGDVYEIMDNGISIGKTSNVEDAAELFATTPQEALEDERFSKAAYPLGAGAHEITIKVASSLNENGTGAIRIVQNMQSFHKKGGKKDDDEDDDNKEHDDGDEDDDEDDDEDEDDKDGEDDEDDERDEDDEDDEGDDNGKGKGRGKSKGDKKPIWIVHTVTTSNPSTSTLTTTTGTVTNLSTETITTEVTTTILETKLLDLPFLTVA
ncbi:hypothetical protein [Parasitella parasitica]|uniref:Uncharacterized protein n=1 Tax=Parasitella parasitica TaxID=35722 RepID=A0A0B7N1V6_9FUNG|nr:hypothetical protein [Parasitella parasitica]